MDLGVLAEGTYDMLCTIAGHAAGGMTGMLHVGAPGATAAARDRCADPTTMTWQEMDAMMEAVAKTVPGRDRRATAARTWRQ